MTALTVSGVAESPEEAASLLPLPWRRMAWVTWRQHRTALIGTAVVLGVLAVFLGIAFACGALDNKFDGMDDFLANGLLLQLLPALIGAFVGAPVLSREMESGTFRFAWTQGFGRWRWTLAKLASLAVMMTAAAGALSVLFSWYYQPYFPPNDQGLSLTKALPIGASSPFAPGLFDLRGVSFAAWTLAAFAIGVFAGALIRRVVPAIVATLVVYTGLAFSTSGLLRQHYLAPLVTSSLNVPGTSWVLSQQWLTRSGRPVSTAMLGQVLQQGASSPIAGKGGVPQSLGAWQYLVQHGYTQLTTYQPTSRFWPFQWIEGGWLLALSVVLIAGTVWLVRRRAT